MIDGEMKWNEVAVTHMQLKSFIARVTTDGNSHKVLGVVLNDGTPIKSVEVQIDNGPWQPATMDSSTNGKYSWKLFSYVWKGAMPGEHTLVSRVTDATGKVQGDSTRDRASLPGSVLVLFRRLTPVSECDREA